MEGAKQYYNIIQKAFKHRVGGLRKLNLQYGWNGGDSEAFTYNNFVFVTSSHARGKCIHIYLIDQHYQNDEDIKNNAFEVFGVVDEGRGWTEAYDWLRDGEGNWVQAIIKYLGNLQSESDSLDHKSQELRSEQKKEEKRRLDEKLNTFNQMFV